ncbi:hypothetical protein Tco_1351647 [Tanacetum coccineum]
MKTPVKKSVRLSVNTIKWKGWTVNTAHPKSTVFSAKPIQHFSKPAQSTVRRPFQTKTALYNKRFTQAVNTARPKVVKTARPNSAVVNVVRVNQANAIKALACWVWRPTKPDSASITFKKHNYIDARGRSKASHTNTQDFDSGCFKHMTGNKLNSQISRSWMEVCAFGGRAHGGKFTVKGTHKTDNP